MDLEHALSELRRLGMHLDPAAAADANERRRVRLNTHTYPLTRVIGFQLLLAVVVVHNAALFGGVDWGVVLLFTGVVEAYLLLSWLALRRWFLPFRAVRGWDLGDIMLATDLLLWAAAIRVTGGSSSLLWVLPLLRVADHHTVARSWVFAHLAPLAYAAAAWWPPRLPGAGWLEGDLVKIVLLYVAGLYIAWTGVPAYRFRQQREAALTAAAALLGGVADRTERLDAARRSRSGLLEELGAGIRASLIEIVGFSRFLLRSASDRPDSERRFVERIQSESRGALRALEDLVDRPAAPLWPRISLSGVMQKVAAAEAAEDTVWRESAMLKLPPGEVEIRADERRLTTLLHHVIAACRHFEGGPPVVELKVDAATGLAEAIVVLCPRRVASGVPADDMFNPFSDPAAGDQLEMTARLELSVARSIGQSLGYEVEVNAGDVGTGVVVKLR